MSALKREEIRNLLGGYASGTLTPAEQQLLFEASMEDQELFDALADEQALKEILDDPESRGYLRNALVAEKKQKSFAWWWTGAGVSAVAAGLAVFMMVGVQRTAVPVAAEAPREMAKNTEPAPVAVPKASAKPKKTVPAPLPASPPQAEATPAPKPEQQAVKEEAEADKAVSAPPPVVVADAAPAPLLVRAPEPPPLPRQQQMQASELYRQQSQVFQQQRRVSQAFRSDAMPASAPRDTRKRAESVAPGSGGAAAGAVSSEAKAAAPAVPNAGIRYRIFRKNSQGQFVETRLDTRFEEGDEIEIVVDKNSSGIVTLLRERTNTWSTIPLASQNLFEARSPAIRLEKGTLHLGIVLGANAEAARGGPRAQANQVTEVTGNSMYVVAPGLTEGTVATDVRILVN